MNDLIKKLKEQATSYTWNGNDVTEELDEEKFAELIVRECAKFLDENSGYDDANNAWHPEPEELLEHFGVEE